MKAPRLKQNITMNILLAIFGRTYGDPTEFMCLTMRPMLDSPSIQHPYDNYTAILCSGVDLDLSANLSADLVRALPRAFLP